MRDPIIAWLTDFGTRDFYVAAMKAVALGICGRAQLVDVTHDIEPQDIAGASLVLGSCYRDFPAGTVFVVVVDPGVGTLRRAVALEAAGHRFVAPDNGVLTAVIDAEPSWRAVELDAPHLQRRMVSRTFEGRDRFAPIAAWLALGHSIDECGRPVSDLERLDRVRPMVRGDRLEGIVEWVDRFGNLVTNIPRETLERFADGRSVRVEAGDRLVPRPVETYAALDAGELGVLVGSTNHVELAVGRGSAAAATGLARGARVIVAHAARADG